MNTHLNGQVRVKCILVSAYLCSVVAIGLIIFTTDSRFNHWFILPVTLCGILMASDALNWARGRVDVFDPIGIIGLLGIHFFFLAPILHVGWDSWLRYISPPPDWRVWLGAMAVINLIGILVYRSTHKWSTKRFLAVGLFNSQRKLDHRSFWPIILLALVVTAGLQAWVFAQFGGVSGYVRVFSSSDQNIQGFGIVFLVSESFPILAMMAFAVLTRQRPTLKSWFWIITALIVFTILKLMFGGLRGSRSNTIWGIFWAVGIVHLWIRPIPRKLIVLGIVFLVGFMYTYGFFKGAGVESIEILANGGSVSELEAMTGRTFEGSILHDLGRSDIQAYVAYRLRYPVSSYEYAKGRTYIAAASFLIPNSLWPGRPPAKVKEGTNLLYGSGAYESGLRASRVYGLAGEAMLNFGLLLVPFAFSILGILVGAIRTIPYKVTADNPWLLIYPVLVNLCFVVLVSDSDNVVFFLIKNISVPFLVVFMASLRVPNQTYTADEQNVSYHLPTHSHRSNIIAPRSPFR